MRTKRIGLRVMVLAMALWGTLLAGSPTSLAAPPEGVLRQAIHTPISADWLDPATSGYAVTGQLPLYLLHDALIKAMPEGLYTPSLAESWKVSPDARVYEFTLRKRVKFHNGDEMTADDVVFSFLRYKAAQAKYIQDKTEKAEAPNPYLVRFTFKEPFPDFLDYLLPGATTIGWVVPKKYVEKVGDAGYKKNPVGCGPYKFVEFVSGVKLVGEAFEDYWRKTPSIKRMEFLIITEGATRLTMVRRGEADIATLIQGVLYEDAKKDPKLRLMSPMSSTRWIVGIGGQWDPKSPWSDVRVRRAASLAIDRKTLSDIHMPGCEGVGEIGLPNDPLAVQYPVDPYDPGKAKSLLAEAGYPNGFKGGTFYPYESGYWPYGEQIANYWKAVGIHVDIVLLDRPAWIAMRQGGKLKGSLCIDYGIAPTIAARLSYLFSIPGFGMYPDIQALWDKLPKEVAPKARKDLLARVQNLIHEKTMFIPLTSTNSPAVFGPKVKGNPYKIQPLIWFTAPFEDVELVK